MGTLRITEAELARDIHGVLAKVQEGAEIVVEQDHRAIAVIRPALPKGRLLSECIAIAEARGSTATLDEGFMKDVEEGLVSRSQPWNPPSWE
jgi:antitoxin (DNA-binding transcriptional repressor) of toxin-antitoxin stability system